jgi:hypothetical protein
VFGEVVLEANVTVPDNASGSMRREKNWGKRAIDDLMLMKASQRY